MAVKKPGSGGGGGYGPGPSIGGVKKGKKVTMTSSNEKSMSWTKKPVTVGKGRMQPKADGTGSRFVKDVPAKRRVGGVGKAKARAAAQANKEIKQERKQSGERVYPKQPYGRKSVNPKMTKVPSRSRSGR